MSLKKIFLKSKITAPRLLFSVFLLMIGSVLISLHQYPGIASNSVAWLETEGMPFSLSIGLLLFFVGLWMLFSTFKQMATHRITYTKGPLVCSLEKGLLEQTVQQLWSEFFDRPDLKAYVSTHGNRLDIAGETPEAWDSVDELGLFLSHKLLHSTGFWGDISLHTSPKARRSSNAFSR